MHQAIPALTPWAMSTLPDILTAMAEAGVDPGSECVGMLDKASFAVGVRRLPLVLARHKARSSR